MIWILSVILKFDDGSLRALRSYPFSGKIACLKARDEMREKLDKSLHIECVQVPKKGAI